MYLHSLHNNLPLSPLIYHVPENHPYNRSMAYRRVAARCHLPQAEVVVNLS